MNEQSRVSEKAQETIDALSDLSFVARSGKVWFKQAEGSIGYIKEADALRGRYLMHSAEGDVIEEFYSLAGLVVHHGWVLAVKDAWESRVITGNIANVVGRRIAN